MNFFKLYIGDYQRDTAHLSVTEHGAYLLMLQHYYATEKPLPVGKALHRMLRAQDKAEREAIDTVVAQFWRETDDGLVNDRADVEITKAGAQAETNRAIAQAREAKRKASRTVDDQSTNRATNDQPNHSHSHSQTPEREQERAPTPAGLVCKALRQVGFTQTNPSDPRLIALLDAGATQDEIVAVGQEAATNAKGWPWLLATVQGRRRDAATIGALPSQANPDRFKGVL